MAYTQFPICCQLTLFTYLKTYIPEYDMTLTWKNQGETKKTSQGITQKQFETG
jgi:hypothetical protein